MKQLDESLEFVLISYLSLIHLSLKDNLSFSSLYNYKNIEFYHFVCAIMVHVVDFD